MNISPTNSNSTINISNLDPNSEEALMAKMGIPVGFDSTKASTIFFLFSFRFVLKVNYSKKKIKRVKKLKIMILGELQVILD